MTNIHELVFSIIYRKWNVIWDALDLSVIKSFYMPSLVRTVSLLEMRSDITPGLSFGVYACTKVWNLPVN